MAKGTSSAKAEENIRRYLTYLKAPGDLVDPKAVARANTQVERTAGGDVIEHVKALAALEQATVVDEAPLRAAFVDTIPGWLEEHGVSVDVLRSFGVPDDVLVEAGLMPAETRKSRSGTRRPAKKRAAAPAPVPPPAPAPAVSSNGHGRGIDYDAIVAALPAGEFLTADVAALLDVDLITARNRIATMRSKGLIVHVGEVDPWTGKGAAPYLYARA